MTDQTRDIVERLYYLRRRALSYASDKPAVNMLLADLAEGATNAAVHIEALTKRVAELEEALERIAEGNLGSMPWQADYAKIREVASTALSNAARGEEG
jgi:hypothetical protein